MLEPDALLLPGFTSEEVAKLLSANIQLGSPRGVARDLQHERIGILRDRQLIHGRVILRSHWPLQRPFGSTVLLGASYGLGRIWRHEVLIPSRKPSRNLRLGASRSWSVKRRDGECLEIVRQSAKRESNALAGSAG